MSRIRGAKSLLHDAVDATTHLVAEGHASVARAVRRVTSPVPALAAPVAAVDDVRDAVTTGVLATIRGVNRAVQLLTDLALDALVAEGGEPPPIPLRSDLIGDRRLTADAATGLLNGLMGDRLGHPGLDLGLTLRHGDRVLRGEAPAGATPRAVVLVHGLATTEWCWSLQAEAWWGDPGLHFGALLERDAGLTPILVRYNTGRRVPDNGERLADALEELFGAWEVEELTLLGHSMGGLVCRAAVLAGTRKGHAWVGRLRRVISLGTPHQGAPLARFSDAATAVLAAVDLPATRILSKILDVRSRGIRDLSWGTVDDDEAPLHPDVAWHFIAGTLTEDAAHPVSHLLGDLLVRVPSAHGPAVERGSFTISTAHLGRVAHHHLQCHPDVYAQVRAACGDLRPQPEP